MTVTAKRASSNRKKHEPAKESGRKSRAAFSSLWSQTVGWSLFSAVGIWLAFPPIGLWPLAWIAPLGWIRLIRQRVLDGRRPLREIYVVGFLHWLLMTHWVTLPHFSAAIGWLFLAAYLAVYVLAFVVIARWLVHWARLTSVLSVPLAWVATEYLRSFLFTGFALIPLSHSQVDFLPILQVADVTGAYGVSFVVMLVAAACERVLHRYYVERSGIVWWPLGIAGICLAAAISYGQFAISAKPSSLKVDRTARVAIVQGSLDTVFGGDQSRDRRAFLDYIRMTRQATVRTKIDLVIWPESMFRIPIVEYDDGLGDESPIPDGYTNREWSELLAVSAKKEVSRFGSKSLLGTSTEHVHQEGTDRYNTAALFDERGELSGSYHKMHPVMFGEYIPLGDYFPSLYKLAPIDNGLAKGTAPKSFKAGEVWFCPNICFENTVPHLIRDQVHQLQESGQRVDALVTLTNDGWFWGSSLLDLHLACGVFRAVENRKPMLIAANTGISAHIDDYGRVLKQGPKRRAQVIITDVRASESVSIYSQYGDVFGRGCVLACVCGVIFGAVRRRRKVVRIESTN